MEKLGKIMQLRIFENRFLIKKIVGINEKVFGFPEMRPDIPFRLLVYFKTSIDNTIMEDLLNRYSEVWDVVFLVDKEEILLNKALPFVIKMELPDRSPKDKFIIWTYIPFLILLLAITRTLPIPSAVDVMATLFNIVTLARNQSKEHRANDLP